MTKTQVRSVDTGENNQGETGSKTCPKFEGSWTSFVCVVDDASSGVAADGSRRYLTS